MTPLHPFVFAVMDIYGNVDTSYHWPWFFKFSLAGLAIRAFFWAVSKLPKENNAPQRPELKRAMSSHSVQSSVPTTSKPPAPAPAAAPAPVPAPAAILVLKDGQQLGPYILDEANRQLSAGTVMASDLAWHEGLAGWEPLATVAGVVPGPSHGLHPPAPPTPAMVRSAAAGGDTSSLSPGGLLIGGYVCAAVSLMFLPPVFGLAGVVCGVVVIKHDQFNRGVTLLFVSFLCAVIGMIFGAMQ